MTDADNTQDENEAEESSNSKPNSNDPANKFITQTDGMSEECPSSPERGDFEIGFENGEGYIKLPIYRNTSDNVEKFTIPAEEVKAYRERRNELNPLPTVPDGVEREPNFKAPDNFEGGEAVHTGGGIYCRIWTQEFVDDIVVEVIYQLPKKDGIGININNERGEFLGEAHVKIFDEFKHDEEIQPHAKELMEQINDGEFDGEIKEAIKNSRAAA